MVKLGRDTGSLLWDILTQLIHFKIDLIIVDALKLIVNDIRYVIEFQSFST